MKFGMTRLCTLHNKEVEIITTHSSITTSYSTSDCTLTHKPKCIEKEGWMSTAFMECYRFSSSHTFKTVCFVSFTLIFQKKNPLHTSFSHAYQRMACNLDYMSKQELDKSLKGMLFILFSTPLFLLNKHEL